MRYPPSRLLATAACVLGLGACSPGSPQDASAAQQEARDARDAIAARTSPADAPAEDARADDDPCRLLSDAEVRAAFPGAGSGERQRATDMLEMATCEWKLPGGRLVLQCMKGEPGGARDWIETVKLDILDPFKARPDIRNEIVGGLGDEAVAMIERADPQRGILDPIAIIAIRRGEYQVAVSSDLLAQRDRAEALAVLTSLGRAAAARL